jgi:glycerol-3-phosphate acyltransferase PlsX
MQSLRTKIGALLAKPAFDDLKKILDPGEIGASLLLGLDGLVFIGHGRSDSRALVSGIRTARAAVGANLLDELRSAIQKGLSN